MNNKNKVWTIIFKIFTILLFAFVVFLVCYDFFDTSKAYLTTEILIALKTITSKLNKEDFLDKI